MPLARFGPIPILPVRRAGTAKVICSIGRFLETNDAGKGFLNSEAIADSGLHAFSRFELCARMVVGASDI